jgi:hypothetical protein
VGGVCGPICTTRKTQAHPAVFGRIFADYSGERFNCNGWPDPVSAAFGVTFQPSSYDTQGSANAHKSPPKGQQISVKR